MDSPKVLKRTITPEIRASRERDIETVLENYRENLKERGVTDKAAVESFIAVERYKMQQEYESLDKGDSSINIYHIPTDWDSIASQIKEQENEEENDMTM